MEKALISPSDLLVKAHMLEYLTVRISFRALQYPVLSDFYFIEADSNIITRVLCPRKTYRNACFCVKTGKAYMISYKRIELNWSKLNWAFDGIVVFSQIKKHPIRKVLDAKQVARLNLLSGTISTEKWLDAENKERNKSEFRRNIICV